MCFVPVQFYSAYPTIAKADRGNSFHLASTTRPELFPQSAEFVNLSANGHGFDIGNLAYEFEVHQYPKARLPRPISKTLISRSPAMNPPMCAA